MLAFQRTRKSLKDRITTQFNQKKCVPYCPKQLSWVNHRNQNKSTWNCSKCYNNGYICYIQNKMAQAKLTDIQNLSCSCSGILIFHSHFEFGPHLFKLCSSNHFSNKLVLCFQQIEPTQSGNFINPSRK